MQTPAPEKLLELIQQGCYYKNTNFDPAAKFGARFLLVFAVPYGESDGVKTVADAIDAAAEFIRSDDWVEREWGIYDHKDGTVHHLSAENINAA